MIGWFDNKCAATRLKTLILASFLSVRRTENLQWVKVGLDNKVLPSYYYYYQAYLTYRYCFLAYFGAVFK